MSGGKTPSQADETGSGAVLSVEELLAHAYAMELEAEDRYRDLAGQMEVHNNLEVAALFSKLAHIEGLHARKLKDRIGDRDLPRIRPWDYEWAGRDSPEAAGAVDAHYLMTPYHALTIALRNEQAAQGFFERIAREAAEGEMREIAEEFAREEAEHVELVRAWLAKFPKPEAGWDEDPDPPGLSD